MRGRAFYALSYRTLPRRLPCHLDIGQPLFGNESVFFTETTGQFKICTSPFFQVSSSIYQTLVLLPLLQTWDPFSAGRAVPPHPGVLTPPRGVGSRWGVRAAHIVVVGSTFRSISG